VTAQDLVLVVPCRPAENGLLPSLSSPSLRGRIRLGSPSGRDTAGQEGRSDETRNERPHLPRVRIVNNPESLPHEALFDDDPLHDGDEHQRDR
jgi:hypothetical protein